MKIAICDDERMFAERLASLITESEAKIYQFESGKDLLESDTNFDIVLLDIEMPHMSGLDIAADLSKKNKNCLILFITSHGQYSTKGYEFRAFRYVLKSEPDDFIKRNINDAIDEYKNNHFYLTVAFKREIAKIRAADIFYIESYGHRAIVHTNDKDYDWQEKFKEVYRILSSHGFLQCHKSYIVNMRRVKSIERNSFVNLTDGKKIPIGRKYNAEVIEKYLRFDDRRI